MSYAALRTLHERAAAVGLKRNPVNEAEWLHANGDLAVWGDIGSPFAWHIHLQTPEVQVALRSEEVALLRVVEHLEALRISVTIPPNTLQVGDIVGTDGVVQRRNADGTVGELHLHTTVDGRVTP